MISIPNGIAKAGEEYGMEVRTGQKVEKILVENGTAFGVKLEDGTEITSKLVVSNLNAQVTYLKLVGPENLPKWAVKAMSELPELDAVPHDLRRPRQEAGPRGPPHRRDRFASSR